MKGKENFSRLHVMLTAISCINRIKSSCSCLSRVARIAEILWIFRDFEIQEKRLTRS